MGGWEDGSVGGGLAGVVGELTRWPGTATLQGVTAQRRWGCAADWRVGAPGRAIRRRISKRGTSMG
jgi:hypothetical protein